MSLPLRPALENVTSVDRVLEDLLVRFIINCPPEDLASVERELFHFEEASWFYIDFVKIINPTLPSLRIKSFAQNIIRLCPLVWKWDIKADEALQKFSKYKKSIPVRGAAIFNEKLNKILLVQGTESDSWSFPRGKISKDEDDVACCIREVREEIGFDLTDYIDENQFIERNIQGKNYKIFLVSGVPEDFPFKPQVRNEINKIEWRDFKKMSKSMFKSSVKYYLVNSMVRPLSMWLRRQKQTKGDDQLKQYAEEQLKLLLGITKEEQVDPGRELLNMLHSAVQLDDEKSDPMPSQPPMTQGSTMPLPSMTNADSLGMAPAPPAFPPGLSQHLPPLMGFQPFAPFPFINGTLPYLNPHMMHPAMSSLPASTIGPLLPPGSVLSTPDASSLSKPIIATEQENQNNTSSSKQLLDLLNTKRNNSSSVTDGTDLGNDSTNKSGSDPLPRPLDIFRESAESNMSDSLALLSILKGPAQNTNKELNENYASAPITNNVTVQKELKEDSSLKDETEDDTYEDFEESSEDENPDTYSEEENSDNGFDYEDFESASELEEEAKLEDLQKEEDQLVNTTTREALKENKFQDGEVPHKDEHTESARSVEATLGPQEVTKIKPKFKLLKRGENLEDILTKTDNLPSRPVESTMDAKAQISNPGVVPESCNSFLDIINGASPQYGHGTQPVPVSKKQPSPEEELMAMLQNSRNNENRPQEHNEQPNSSAHLLSVLRNPPAKTAELPIVPNREDLSPMSNAVQNSNQTASSELLGMLKRPTNGIHSSPMNTHANVAQVPQNIFNDPFRQNNTQSAAIASNDLLNILHRK